MDGVMISKHNEQRKRFEEKPLDGQDFRELVQAGLEWLRTNCEIVNALNVFPVPDGDTGTNMVLTLQSALDEVSNFAEKNVGKMIQHLAHGALMGARGNSGVILSQIWRGFARSIGESPTIDVKCFADAFKEARITAYRGVVRPVEGTILTVSKDMALAAEEAKDVENFVELLECVVNAASLSVENTPQLLPILKEAGVVDSGGKGLFFIFEGMLRYINGKPLDRAEASLEPLAAIDLDSTLQEIEPGQDYEVIVDFMPESRLDLNYFYSNLEKMGTSIQVGEGDGLYRVHIHVPTENRYEPIEFAMSIGTITKVHIENLLIQMEEMGIEDGGKLQFTPVEPGQIAVIAVSPGSGISRIFASLGVAAIVEGGQTMNPSTKDILQAFENLPTDFVIILPNNKNIIMCANAATELTVKKAAVIPTQSIPQGLAAMLCLDSSGLFDEVVERMEHAIEDVETGEITVATRAVEIEGVMVQEGQIIVLHNGKLVMGVSNLEEGCLAFLEHAHAEDYELITLFFGIDVSHGEANRIADRIREAYPEHEIELQDGGQPHYQFIISIE